MELKFETVVVMLEGRAGIIRRGDVDALHLTGVERQQHLQCFQVVALDEHVACMPAYLPKALAKIRKSPNPMAPSPSKS